MKRLSELAEGLRKRVGDANFSFLNTRLVLSTGVDLRNIRKEQDDDPALVERVQDALRELGYAHNE